MEKALWRNIKILAASVLLVLGFMYIFSIIYDKVRIKPSCEVKDYKVEIQIQKKDGTYAKLDSCQYKVVPAPQIFESPIEANDYSSFLISFISVLATFVVIANFANAKDLIASSDNAEKARKEAEEAKKDAENAKADSESIKNQVTGQITEVNKILSDVKTLKTAVEQTKHNADESLSKASQLIAEQKATIEAQFGKLGKEVSDAQTVFAGHKTEIDAKQNGLIELYNEVSRQIEHFEKEVSEQRAEISAAIQRLGAVENTIASLKNNGQMNNVLEDQKQLDTESSNQTMSINIEVNNSNIDS